jgi:hypothetical protein
MDLLTPGFVRHVDARDPHSPTEWIAQPDGGWKVFIHEALQCAFVQVVESIVTALDSAGGLANKMLKHKKATVDHASLHHGFVLGHAATVPL